MFMPPSSHQFSFLFSSLHFSPVSLLSPSVNYLLSVQFGQELHFRSDRTLKKWLCRLETGAIQPASLVEGAEAEKMLIG